MPVGLIWNGPSARSWVLQKFDSAMNRAGEAVVEEARRLVPVDTGRLRASIGFTYSTSRRVLTVYADEFYAAFVEFGTSKMAAQPFLRPALGLFPRLLGLVVTTQVQFSNTPEQYGGPETLEGPF